MNPRKGKTRRRRSWWPLLSATAFILAVVGFNSGDGAQVRAQCGPNPIVCENAQAGNPSSEWDVSGAGDDTIQGFATDISVNRGQTVSFKIDTNATNYRLDIYRMGYYGGLGARKITTVNPTATLPQNQPACLTDSATGLVDCGNWAVSASWAVPATAVSGIYFAKVVRTDSGGASHIVFIVRDDASTADLFFQTSDTTWQAYNTYGGNSLYQGSPVGRAYKVSYNRPFITRGNAPEDWVFNAEYPMVRWLEANGYNIAYTTGVDSDRSGARIQQHRVFVSVGHDEYWSGTQRTNVESARAAGVNLAFFSGNEVFWKTRWENSISASATAHRTLVTYKETHANGKIDPNPAWTGTWRDPRFSPPADGGKPENALTGTIFMVNSGTTGITVPSAEGKMRFWRNTSIANLAPGGSVTLPNGTLGYEWDEDLDNGFRPAGLVRMSDSTVSGVDYLQDHGSTYGPGTANHALTLYRHSSGALVFGAGTVQWSWGLDSNHDRGSAAPSVQMRQATVNLFADMGVQAATLQTGTGLVSATASTDTTAPTSIITSPAHDSGVPANTFVTITGTASDSGGGIVGGVEVSVDGGLTWRRATGRESWSYSWQTGAPRTVSIFSRAVDDSGRLEVPVTGVSVTVGVGTVQCPCSLWAPSQVPAGAADNDGSQVELGTRFRSDAAGYITGIRFYKHLQNAGTHVGNLWTAGGTRIATVTFTGETTSGWQEALLPSPVQIAADTFYVVSYNSPLGIYAGTDGYFGATGVDSGPLHAPRDGTEGGANGLYRYGSNVFPNQTYQGENYWVDVVFVTSIAADTTPPVVNGVTPASGSSTAPPNTTVTATFNENVTNVSQATFELTGGGVIPANVTYSAGARTATLTPTAPLAYSTTYTARLRGGPGNITDTAGNPLASDYVWSFTTAGPPPPPPNEGPGGPILVVASTSDPFSRYYAEILRAEGLNAFTVTDISLVTPTLLLGYDVVVAGAIPLTDAQATMFGNWVSAAGGNMIAMRPDKKLASLLGLTDAAATLSEGYLLVNTSAAPGSGIVGETMQFHGVADRYSLNDATSVATLYSNATTATANPAVTLRSVGTLGGQAAAFTFDLARSIVLTRQGNPAWSGQERDGITPIRSDDLFFGGAQTDWVNLNKVAIPQADEQQRLLANLILHMNGDRRLLPRFWYFPRGEKAVVVMTGDDHAANGTAGRFDIYKNNSPVNCSVNDWECIRATSYIYPTTPITNAQAAGYEADGFEIAVHITTNCLNYTPASLQTNYANDLAQFASLFPSVSPATTNRTHCIAWSDFDTQPQVALANGIRLDTNYYYYPGTWVQDRPGFMTGSGMPMRFAKADGTMVDVYQAATQMTDESGQTWPFTVDTLLDRAIGAEGYYGVFTTNMHTDFVQHVGSEAIVASAIARSVPVISAKQLLTWVDGRNGSSFSNITWNGTTMGFTVVTGAGSNGLEGMIPAASGSNVLLNLTRAGANVSYRIEAIKGISYAIFSAPAGAYQATYGVDSTAPVITGLAAAPAINSATITWTTNEASDSRVDYGTAPDALSLSASVSGLTGAHSVPLSALAGGTTYYYRARSADASGNPATSPAPPSAPATFTTSAPPSYNCPCTIWPGTATPAVISEPDNSAVELGVKFRTSIDGFITGIRFYKGPQNIGTHVGNLWTASGTLLSSVTFTGETASGWQVASLPSPVSVIANTVYVVSYHAPSGFYSLDTGYFSAPQINGPLEAPANGTFGGNGVYRYGPTGFPTDAFGGSNYWVDAVFETSIAPDTTAPTVVSTVPGANATNVNIANPVRVTFSEAMNGGSIHGGTYELRDAGSNLVAAVVSYNQLIREATLQPSGPLAYSGTYTATVRGGSTGVKDVSGNALAANHSWSFTTADPPPPPPDEGPGGPIMIVSSTANPFSKYYAEILRAEGLNAFLVSDITAVTPSTLAAHDVVLLGEVPLTSAQVTMFATWVSTGGKLIAMRPDKQLASLLGLTDAAGTLAEAYLQVDTSAAPGAGIVGETMQFHGTADLYTLNGATPVATLFADATSPTPAPAVTLRSVGGFGGQVAAFTYDLARSIVYTRQGNPAWSGQERDGIAPIRSDDLFFGGAEPDYVDRSKVAIPQADEQQRLLANLIGLLSADRKPLPRFWYFPRGHKAVIVMTGDDHASASGTTGQFNWFNSQSVAGCSVANWECIRGTSYIYPDTPITPAAAGAFVAQGHEIGVHITTGCGDYTAESIGATYTSELAAFASVFGSLPTPRTNRTHCIAWSDYTSQAETAHAHGIRLDTNYYYWPGTWVNNVPGLFTGSAMPMRFAKADGTMIDVYQAATQMTDESAQVYPFTADALLNRALGPEGYFGAYVTNMHTDFPNHAGAQAIVASAKARGVPVITAKQLLDWLDGRNASVYTGLAWVGNSLTFAVTADAKANGLQVTLPAATGNRFVTGVTRDGQPVAFTIVGVKGVNYVVFDSASGSYSVQYTTDDSAPLVTAISTTPDASEAMVTWTTNEGATSRVEYGTSPNAMSSAVADFNLKTAHSLQLTGLEPGTTYFFRVASGDIVGNTSTAPAPPAAPSFFTTLTTPTFGCPCSIWNPGQVPAQPSSADANAIELGLKFRPSADGFVTAVRFYKGALNTGTHVGNLWTSGGTLLATAPFTNETASGWQEAALPQPVAVTANTTYVVSYHASTGGYAADQFFFQSSGVTNGPLQALAEGVSGSNGVFRYGASSFPTEAFRSTNYWVDLVFMASLPPPPPDSETLTDTTVADFSAGTPGSGSFVANRENGEVILQPTVHDMSALPAGWSSAPWAAGGVSSPSGGQVTVNGALLGSDTQVLPEQSVEFVATFSGDPFQHAGFALTFNENLWAMFSTGTLGGALSARTHNGATAIDTPIAGNWLGAPHRYRVNWSAAAVTFFVDGNLVASHSTAINAAMRAMVSDFSVGAGGIIVDSIEMTPHATSGTFTSRVLDAGTTASWTSATSTSVVPSGTTLALSARFGNTAIPDASWSGFTGFSLGTASISATSRYVQYRAVLTGPGSATPELRSITFGGTDVLAPPAVSVSDATVVEGTSQSTYAVFTLSMTPAVPNTVSVSYATTGGTAVTGTDFLTTSGTAVFPAGSTTTYVLVPIVGDTSIEVSEAFTLGLSAPVNATLAQAVATGTIVDDDVPVLTIGDSSVLEGQSGTASLVFVVSLSTASNQEVSVNFSTSDGTAVSPQDYVSTSGGVTFPIGVTTRQIAVQVAGDTLDEANESLIVTLSAPVNAPIVDATGVGTVVDNDPTPSLSVSDASVAEPDIGTSPALFTVTLSPASGRTVSVNYTTADGIAVAPGDYAATSGSVVFAPGQTTAQVSVAAAGDVIDEPSENFLLNLLSPTNATIADSQAIGTIVDNDQPGITIADLAITEGNNGTQNAVFVVSLATASPAPVSVNYATANGTATEPADYTTRTGTLTIPANILTGQITVPVVGDTLDEPDETFNVVLSAPVNGVIADATAVATIADNDATPSFVINNVTVGEGDAGTTTAGFVVTLSAASGQIVSVNYATANVNATAPADYTAASGTLTFAPGVTTQPVPVTIIGDTLEEPNETFQVNLSVPVNATIADSLGVGTITDNEPPLITINDRSVSEATANVAFTVSLSNAHTLPVSVNYATSNGTAIAPADYGALAGTLTIPAGATSAQFTVVQVNDLLDEANETYTVTLSSPVNGTIADGTGLGTITDNDATPSLVVNDVSVGETDTGEAVSATFTVTLSAVSGRAVTVNFATLNGTATVAAGDYTATSGTLTFDPGVTTQQVNVSINGDLLDEVDETVQLRLSAATSASIADNNGIGTIVDNDPTPTASINNATIAEANSGTRAVNFTVTLSAAAGRTITVTYTTANNTAVAPGDYTAATGTVTFAAGQTTRPITITSIGDTAVEPNESFFVNLSNPNPTTLTFTDSQGVGTINNND